MGGRREGGGCVGAEGVSGAGNNSDGKSDRRHRKGGRAAGWAKGQVGMRMQASRDAGRAGGGGRLWRGRWGMGRLDW
jgi:hypothetical protein